MEKTDQALEYFHTGFNCAQSVLATFGLDYGLTEEQCLKIACAFGAGMGRKQYTCGAVTGALMVLGLQYGRGKNDDNTRKLATYEKTKMLFEAFAKKYGTTSCLELLDGLHMDNPEEMKKINELDFHHVRCAGYVKYAVELVQHLIENTDTNSKT